MIKIIYEYQVIPTEIAQTVINTSKLHRYFSFDWGVLKSRQYCGIVQIEKKDYYLLPKISDYENTNLDIFIYMLKFVYDIKLHNEDIASSKNILSKNLLEMFVQLFARNLMNELKKGIFKEYTTEQKNLTTLKGKYLINENIKYNFTNNKIYCEYDEFSSNNTLNQFFLYAIKVLQNYVRDKKLLKQCELIFDEVEYKQQDINKLDIHFNRLNARFKTSFEVALLLLQNYIPLFEKDKKSFAFLFDMNLLFEKFIAKIIDKNYDGVELGSKSKIFGALRLKPDIIVDSKKLIIDCKYKKIDEKKIDRNDKYQMYAYGNNFNNIDTTMLLFPQNLNNEPKVYEDAWLGKNDKKVLLKIKTLNLNFDGGYEEFIEEMKNRIGEMI